MYYYKFRVFFDEIEDFVRDIEISSTDNFESFHQILYSSIGLQGNELASFSICDTKWNKQKEIMLIDMGDEETEISEPAIYEENDIYTTKSNLPKFVMKDAILKDFIDNPHQYIIYEYDFMYPKIFFIELLKTFKVENAIDLPRCTYKEKELPKEEKRVHHPMPEELNKDAFGNLDFNDEDDEYDDGFDDEDFLDLEDFDEIKDL